MALVLNGSNDTITGLQIDSANIVDGSIVNADINANAAIASTKLSGISAGITMHDNWYVSSAFSLSTGGTQYITSNWTRDTRTETGSIGSAMTQSSGVFTFPSTGIYRISIRGGVYGESSNRKYFSWSIYSTTDNSSYGTLEAGYNGFTGHGAYTYAMFTVQGVFDVTDVSTHKIKFAYSTDGSGLTSQDIGGRNLHIMFTRLGGT